MSARLIDDMVTASRRHQSLAGGFRMAGDRDLAAAASRAATALQEAATALDAYNAAAAEADSFAREC